MKMYIAYWIKIKTVQIEQIMLVKYQHKNKINNIFAHVPVDSNKRVELRINNKMIWLR